MKKTNRVPSPALLEQLKKEVSNNLFTLGVRIATEEVITTYAMLKYEGKYYMDEVLNEIVCMKEERKR